ncbi:Predicted ATPase [Actinomadura meyerae]|uniref:Predicted ATPase n=1 Tax=Actinomadura meyerae TaxID=240840 RepID=A0A239NG72_9ACTN|nr:LuxR family transcriptional regulator [Actinomadura meyerae]SNT53770.1 Predicted ATPase [Actinomadura meyerae]
MSFAGRWEESADTVRPAETRRALAALDAGKGRIIELSGDPGSGKTRLLGEMMKEARRRGIPVTHIRCTEFERQLPYYCLAQLLGTQPFREATAALPADDRALIEQMIARARLPCPADKPGTTWEFHRAAAALWALLCSPAATKPLIIFEDFHWADLASAELIDHLVRHPGADQPLLVITHRPRQTPPRLLSTFAHAGELGTITRIELSPLSLEQSAELLGLLPDDPRLAALHRESEGIPLYLIVLAHAVLGGEPDDGLGAVAADGPRCLPPKIAGLLRGELAALGERDFLIAAAAAVLDGHSDIKSLMTLTGFDATVVKEAVTSLLARDLLRAVPGKANFAFRHPVLRRVAYSLSDSAWLLGAHHTTLRTLMERGVPPSELAPFVERSLGPASAEHANILASAAEEALRTAPDLAARWLKIAVAELPAEERSSETGIRLLLLQTKALGLSGRLDESRGLLHQAIQQVEAGDSALPSAIAFAAIVECLLGNFTEARAVLSRTVSELLAADNPPPETADLLIEHGLISAFDGHPPSCDQVRMAISIARRHHDRLSEAGAVILNGLCDTFNGLPNASGEIERAALLIDELSDSDLVRHPEYLGLLGWAESMVGRYSRAERHFSRGVDIARNHGQRFLLPVLLLGLGNVHRHSRSLKEAARLARKARELAEEMRLNHVRGLALALEAFTTAWTGEPDEAGEAVRLAEQAVTVLSEQRFYWEIAGAVVLSNVCHLTGDPRRAYSVLLEAGGGPDLPAIPPFLRPQCYTMIITSGVEAGEQARDWAERAERAATSKLPVPEAYANLARGLERTAAGDPASAAAHAQRAADRFASAGMSHAKACALTVVARNLIELGDPERALPPLSLARELARRCDGWRVMREVETLERAAGSAVTAGPADAPLPAVDLSVLTNREREIAAITGSGLRTKEIAEELSLSPRTVEVHLNRVYRKLNISSRSMLIKIMHRADRGRRYPHATDGGRGSGAVR